MKKFITVDQLKKLFIWDKNFLKKWWKPELGDIYYKEDDDFILVVGKNISSIDREHSLPLLSIGQMIEFLAKEDEVYYIMGRHGDELCDDLWDEVKKIIGKKSIQ